MRLILLLLSCFTIAHSYKILCIVPVPSKSHNTLGKAMVRALLKAGHEVTWVTPYEDSKPQKGLTIVSIPDALTLVQQLDMTDNTKRQSLSLLLDLGRNVSSFVAENKQLREILLTQQFDGVVTEWFMSDILAGIAAVQQVPWVVLFAGHMFPQVESLVDDVRSVATVPSLLSGYALPMTFWQRLSNTVSYFMFSGLMWYNAGTDASYYESYFSSLAQARGIDLPPFGVAYSNISILLINSHPSIAPAQSLPPNVVNIAGFHIDEGTPLPKDLQEIMDNSPQGVVYFSLGSVVKPSFIPKETIRELIEIFGSLKMTVLWKLDDVPEGLPKNIHVRKWWPQSDVLAHPNIRLFITHSGGLSTIEAVHFGVPLLALPVFGDQPGNARAAERAGFARVVPYEAKFAPKLKIALSDLLNDDRYYNRAKYLSKLFKSRPEPPSKLVSHYVELAIETKGAYHLRSASYLYKWYERWMLDQVAFLVVVLYVLKKVLQKVCSVMCGKKQEVQKKEGFLEKQKPNNGRKKKVQ